MTITLTVAGRIATVDATTHVVAGNTYPVTLSLDSEWTGSLYLRVRFGSLYYDIPFASSDTSVDVQMPVGFPEVGIGVFSEALQICTNEARIRLLRSILEAGEQVVEFDSDLYDQWAGEVSELLCDDAFDAESTRPVKNSVITAWKDTVPIDSALVHKTGQETIGGNKIFTDQHVISSANTSIVRLRSALSSDANSWKAQVNIQDSINGSPGTMANLAWGSYPPGGYEFMECSVKKPDRSAGYALNIRAFSDHLSLVADPYYPVDGSGNPQALGASELMRSGNIAVDPRLVHTTGNEVIAGAKTFTSLLTASNVAVKDASTPTITMLKGSTEVASLASDEAQVGLTASSQFFGLRGLGTAPFGQAPSYTADNSADAKIVTRSMLATTPTVVHTTGSETIAGVKTFSASTVINRLERGYTLTVIRAGEWAKLYEFPPATNGANIVFSVINFWTLTQFVGAEVRVAAGNSPNYDLMGLMYGIEGVLNGKVARRADNTIEVWVQNTLGSGIDISTEITHQRSTTPKPIGQIGTMPVVGDTYVDVVDMTRIS